MLAFQLSASDSESPSRKGQQTKEFDLNRVKDALRLHHLVGLDELDERALKPEYAFGDSAQLAHWQPCSHAVVQTL